ncbi:hypothetical protein HanIR_Chr14g0682461 [Helianthus annuus]|nr:hypothetical protein HanIR_Chr14g0682461 [Helianthus annuus]
MDPDSVSLTCLFRCNSRSDSLVDSFDLCKITDSLSEPLDLFKISDSLSKSFDLQIPWVGINSAVASVDGSTNRTSISPRVRETNILLPLPLASVGESTIRQASSSM